MYFILLIKAHKNYELLRDDAGRVMDFDDFMSAVDYGKYNVKGEYMIVRHIPKPREYATPK